MVVSFVDHTVYVFKLLFVAESRYLLTAEHPQSATLGLHPVVCKLLLIFHPVKGRRLR